MKRVTTLIALLTLLTTGLQAQIIDATNNSPHKKEKTSINSSVYKPTGHYLRLEAGYAPIFLVSVAYGYQINPYIMAGGGVGIGYAGRDYEEISSKISLPIYAEAIFSTPRHKWSFFFDIKIGRNSIHYYYDDRNTFHNVYGMIDLRIGFNYKNFGLACGIGMFYLDAGDTSPCISIYYNIPLKVNR